MCYGFERAVPALGAAGEKDVRDGSMQMHSECPVTLVRQGYGDVKLGRASITASTDTQRTPPVVQRSRMWIWGSTAKVSKGTIAARHNERWTRWSDPPCAYPKHGRKGYIDWSHHLHRSRGRSLACV